MKVVYAICFIIIGFGLGVMIASWSMAPALGGLLMSFLFDFIHWVPAGLVVACGLIGAIIEHRKHCRRNGKKVGFRCK